ncbi:MAG: tetratricopeptide repeat protein [Planctomycetota bacterium]
MTARVELAAVLFWNEEAERALAALKPVDWSRVPAATQLQGIDVHLATKEYETAEPLLRALMKSTPGHRGARLRLAALLSWTERYDESLALYEALLAETPKDIGFRRKYAMVLIWADRLEEGAAQLKATLPDDPQDASANDGGNERAPDTAPAATP